MTTKLQKPSSRRYGVCRYFLCLVLAVSATYAFPQTGSDAAYQAKRDKALELFSQGKRLQALPLLEELVKANPRDDEMLVALAACLVNHASTLTDAQAAGQERLRARDLLDQARKLGNTSTLAENLSELLIKLPDSGAIKFSSNPEVEKAMEAGEAAFSRRDFDEALKNYGRALELEPKNYTATLFTANTYDKQNQFSQAADWYQRAIELDRDTETAYRYYADMAAREGDMKKARSLLIDAAVAEPYNRMVWRELHAWAMLNHTKINEIYVGVPAPEGQPQTSEAQEIVKAWHVYQPVRDKWKQSEFKKRFPAETQYRHSLAEEYEALSAVAQALNKLKLGKKSGMLSDPGAELLLRLDQSHMLEPYVLFSLGDAGIAKDYAGYRAQNRERLKAYLEEFVVPE